MKHILAYRFSAFGDVAMLVPVFREFLAQNPDVKITFVSRKNFEALFKDISNLSFYGVDLNDYKGVFGLWRLFKQIKEIKPDGVADLHFVLRSRILSTFFRLNGVRTVHLHKGKTKKKHLTNVFNVEKQQLKSTTERYADVFRTLGFKLNLSNKLPENNIPKSGIGFAPFAQHKGKMLPLEKSFELVRRMAANDKVYLFGGGKKEVEILSDWENKIPNVENLAGKLTLEEELNRISQLKVMISMDSANMHLASLVGTQVVSVWGATHRFAGFLGYGQNVEDIAEVKDLTCRPCSVFGNKPCYRGDYACLNELTVEQILNKL